MLFISISAVLTLPVLNYPKSVVLGSSAKPNHWRSTKVVGTQCIQDGELLTTMNISKIYLNPLLHSPSQNAPSQWFLNLLPNQAWAAELAAQIGFGRIFKNHWLLTNNHSQKSCSGFWIFCQTKLWLLVWKPMQSLAKYSRTTDSE